MRIFSLATNGRAVGAVAELLNETYMKPEIENLKVWMSGKSTTGYQRALAMREFEQLLTYVAELEQLRQPPVSGSLLISFGMWLQKEGWAWKIDNIKERWGRAKKNWNGRGGYWEWKSSKQLLECFIKEMGNDH